ncbi:hypothetical protein Dimus_015709 [Dionaea muscipula]
MKVVQSMAKVMCRIDSSSGVMLAVETGVIGILLPIKAHGAFLFNLNSDSVNCLAYEQSAAFHFSFYLVQQQLLKEQRPAEPSSSFHQSR